MLGRLTVQIKPRGLLFSPLKSLSAFKDSSVSTNNVISYSHLSKGYLQIITAVFMECKWSKKPTFLLCLQYFCVSNVVVLLSFILGWPKYYIWNMMHVFGSRLSLQFSEAASRCALDLTKLLFKKWPNLPLTSRGRKLNNNDRLQSQDVASEYILKEIYFTPQNKKGKGLGMWYIGNVLTTVVYIFFGVSSEKNVNTVIIIALYKSRLMPVFPPITKLRLPLSSY